MKKEVLTGLPGDKNLKFSHGLALGGEWPSCWHLYTGHHKLREAVGGSLLSVRLFVLLSARRDGLACDLIKRGVFVR